MTGFLGRYEYQLDEKGRLSLPAEYRRKASGSRFVLLKWESTHLTLFPEDVWEDVSKRLLELRRGRRDLATKLRDVMSRATEVVPDKQGRFLIPAWLREQAGLGSSVFLIGAIDRVELWNSDSFRRQHPDDLDAEGGGVEEMHRIFG